MTTLPRDLPRPPVRSPGSSAPSPDGEEPRPLSWTPEGLIWNPARAQMGRKFTVVPAAPQWPYVGPLFWYRRRGDQRKSPPSPSEIWFTSAAIGVLRRRRVKNGCFWRGGALYDPTGVSIVGNLHAWMECEVSVLPEDKFKYVIQESVTQHDVKITEKR